jgi:PAS domain S-box-containing protein
MPREHEFREDLLDAIPDVLYAFDTNGRMVWWNSQVTAVTGYTDAEIAAMHPLDFVAPQDKEQIAESIARLTSRETPEIREAHLVTKDGDYLPYEFTGAPLTDDEGAVWGVAGVGRNIAARKRFERISDGCYALDTDWRFTYLNSRAEELVGRSEEDLLGAVVWEEFPDAVDTKVYDEFHTAMETQDPVSFDQYYSPLDTWFAVRAYPSETGVLVYLRDITDRKERERELEQYRTLTEAANDVIVTIDDESIIQAVNPSVTDVFGYDPDELLGKPLTTLMPDDLATQHRASLQRYLETGVRTLDWSDVEVPGIRAHGSAVPLSTSFSEVEYDDQRFFTGIIRDTTERREREQELAYQKALLEAQAETTVDGLLVTDPDRNVLFHNERFLELWDIPDAVAATRSDDTLIEYVDDQLADPDEFRRKIEHLYDRPDVESWYTIELADGRWFDRYSAPVVHDGTHYGRLWAFRDITDRKEREQTLADHRTALAQLNQFNTLVQNLVHAVVAESTRREIEQTVCDHLAASEFYRGAWIGEQTRTAADIVPRVEAGVDSDVVSGTAEVTGANVAQEIAQRAAGNQDIVVVQPGSDDAVDTAYHDAFEATDIDSVLAVPIEHEDALYGVLVVYATDSTALDERQQASFADLGKTIGFTIAAAERKEALVAESALELTLGIRNGDQLFTHVASELESAVKLEGIAGHDAERYLTYVTVSDASPDEIRALAAQTEGIDQCRVVSTHETDCFCEVGITDASLLTTVAEYGGTVTDMTAEADHASVRIELPQTADVSRVLDALQTKGADVELHAKQAVDRPIQTEQRFQATVTDRLTDKQRNTLETAYLAGFFEQPRQSTGEDIAASLDISPSTFHQHIRVGLRKLVDPIVETRTESA